MHHWGGWHLEGQSMWLEVLVEADLQCSIVMSTMPRKN